MGESDIHNPVLEAEIKADAFNVAALATIIKAGPYYGGYSSYHLFSANCWSWARGLTLDIALAQYKAIEVARLHIGEEAGVPMTADELQVCMLTQYGAWGRLLLSLTTGGLYIQLVESGAENSPFSGDPDHRRPKE